MGATYLCAKGWGSSRKVISPILRERGMLHDGRGSDEDFRAILQPVDGYDLLQ